jgi:hypothetical protein
MSSTPFPFLAEISRLQEQLVLPLLLKVSRLREQLLLNIGSESAAEVEPEFLDIYRQCQDYTLTSFKSMYALYQAACYVAQVGIEGDFAECGVWKGGSSMIVALAFLRLNGANRKLYLYDTYDGMPGLGGNDENVGDHPFKFVMNFASQLRGGHAGILYAPLDDVRRNMQSTGYPSDLIEIVKGLVESTIPRRAPEQISLLHLDSDLYESTYHELTHLYPRLAKGGVLMIDDYGSWKGSRKATDQYFAENGISMLLTPAGDEGARLGIKP